MNDVIRRLRDALRPAGSADLWLNDTPTREEIEERLGTDDEARALLFDWSMAEFVERYLLDERLQIAYLGQGVIGTNASPFDAGTASIRFHHSSGRLGGLPGMWGYVRGGMGMVFILLLRPQPAKGPGATVVCDVPVARKSCPVRAACVSGVVSASQRVPSSPTLDPRTTLRLQQGALLPDPAWRARIEEIPIEGCTLKLNVHLQELPNFTARPGTNEPHHYGQINIPLTKEEWKTGSCSFAERRIARPPLVRTLLPKRARCIRRAPAGHAHHERFCAIRPIHLGAG